MLRTTTWFLAITLLFRLLSGPGMYCASTGDVQLSAADCGCCQQQVELPSCCAEPKSSLEAETCCLAGEDIYAVAAPVVLALMVEPAEEFPRLPAVTYLEARPAQLPLEVGPDPPSPLRQLRYTRLLL